MKMENAYWFRVRIGSDKRRKIQPSVTYVVHYPNTRYLVITGLKATSVKFLLQVAATFSYTCFCYIVQLDRASHEEFLNIR